jgi:hypothetical protein
LPGVSSMSRMRGPLAVGEAARASAIMPPAIAARQPPKDQGVDTFPPWHWGAEGPPRTRANPLSNGGFEKHTPLPVRAPQHFPQPALPLYLNLFPRRSAPWIQSHPSCGVERSPPGTTVTSRWVPGGRPRHRPHGHPGAPRPPRTGTPAPPPN